MKHLIPVVLVAATITACGSDEPSIAEAKPVQPNPAIEGLWVSTEAYDPGFPDDRYVIPSDELLYFNFTGASDNPIDAEVFVHSEVENCFLYDADSVTHIGKNRYRDTFNEVVEVSTSNGKLFLEIEFEGPTLVAEFDKVTDISKLDIPVCETNNDLQNDDSMDSIFSPIVSLFD